MDAAGRFEARMISDDPRSWMWTDACAMLDRAERLHRQFFAPAPAPDRAQDRGMAWTPPVDVFEDDRQVAIVVALPGVRPEHVAIELEGDTLTIRGHRPLPDPVRGAAIRRLEIPHGRFERRIAFGGAARLRLDRRELVDGCLVLTFWKHA
jgi:HSP20 family molecular chaperone IbpA